MSLEKERVYRASIQSFLYQRPSAHQWLFDRLVEFFSEEAQARRLYAHIFGREFSTPKKPEPKKKARTYAPRHKNIG